MHYSKFFQLSPSHGRGEGYTRGHSKKLIKPSLLVTGEGNWFAIRCIEDHGTLSPIEVVSAPSTATFKKRYDLYVAQENSP